MFIKILGLGFPERLIILVLGMLIFLLFMYLGTESTYSLRAHAKKVMSTYTCLDRFFPDVRNSAYQNKEYRIWAYQTTGVNFWREAGSAIGREEAPSVLKILPCFFRGPEDVAVGPSLSWRPRREGSIDKVTLVG